MSKEGRPHKGAGEQGRETPVGAKEQGGEQLWCVGAAPVSEMRPISQQVDWQLPGPFGGQAEGGVGPLNGLVAGMAAFAANEVGNEHNEDQASQCTAHGDGDQHAVLIHRALLGCPELPTIHTEGLQPHLE